MKTHRLFREEQIVLFEAGLGGLKRGSQEEKTKKIDGTGFWISAKWCSRECGCAVHLGKGFSGQSS